MTASPPTQHVADPTGRAPSRRSATRHRWAIAAWSVSLAGIVASVVTVAAGAILALQATLAGLTQGSTFAVAAATLVVFALFQPLRPRVQVTVDRRFDRARWDAERVVASFAADVRDQVELERLRHAVVSVVDEAIAPAANAIWMRSKT
jgi:hypothetical protein